MINGQQQGNPIDDPGKTNSPKHSKFDDLSNTLYNTLRYGELSPILALECVPSDKISFRNDFDIRTLTMANPFLSHVKMNKDFYNVPMEAILPLNWDKVYTNPVIGDDVPKDVNCVSVKFFDTLARNVTDIVTTMSSLLENLPVSPASSSEEDIEDWNDTLTSTFSSYFRLLFILEMFFSNGSLLNTLGFKLSTCFRTNFDRNGVYKGIDSHIDDCLSSLFKLAPSLTFTFDTTTIRVRNRKDFRRCIQYCRSDFFSIATNVQPVASVFSALTEFKAHKDSLPTFIVPSLNTMPAFNFGRLCAYQLVCAHFYTNDKIDYIYSAELLRQLVGNYYSIGITGDSTVPRFVMNGIFYNYDWFSGFVFDKFLEVLRYVHNSRGVYSYFALLLSYKHSLKYKDYFTGARSNPLAVGDTNIPVTADNVSVLDVTRKIQIQRFLNNVNKTGRKFSEYIQGLFGESVGYDYHNPAFLSHSSDYILSHEVQNTGSEQFDANSISSMIKSSSGKFEFTFDSDRPSIIIGLAWFDVRRVYHRTTERQFFHADRFDMFNPYMQYIGDQSVYKPEIDLSLGNNGVFAYQSRYQEYKEKVDTASGAFAFPFDELLPNWLFLADDVESMEHIKPSYIRSRNDEFDKFFGYVNGFSLGSYFHFIYIGDNSVSAVRPMSVHPQIL